jgi:hypothetical protein
MNKLNFTFEQRRNINPVFSVYNPGIVGFDTSPTYCSLSIEGLPKISQMGDKLAIEATSEHFDQIADFLNKFNFGTEGKKKLVSFVKKASKSYRKKNVRKSKRKN